MDRSNEALLLAGGLEVRRVVRVVTADELNNLQTAPTPPELIPAPGAGFYISVLSCVAVYKAGLTPFSVNVNSHLILTYSNGGAPQFLQCMETNFLDQDVDQIMMNTGFTLPAGFTSIEVATDIENEAVSLGGDQTSDGDGSVIFVLLYAIVPLIATESL